VDPPILISSKDEHQEDCQVSRRASPVGPSLAQTRYDELPGALRPRGMRSKVALDSLRNTLARLGKYFEVRSDYTRVEVLFWYRV